MSGRGGRTSLTAAELADLAKEAEAEEQEADGTFQSLVTRWEVRPLGEEEGRTVAPGRWTRVGLRICYQFANPMYQLATERFADEIARVMIDAFEGQAREVLGEPKTD